MRITVLLAGVVDPKWRLTSLAEPKLPRRLSPFDEAALETALKLRDADAAAQVTAVLVGGAETEPLARAVAAFRPHRCFRFAADPAALWDPAVAIRLLAAAVAATTPLPDLVLMGREFGDTDDGMLPPALAEAMGWPFCGLVHAVAAEAGTLLLRRSRGPREEVLRRRGPVLASITNERGNRLRHPLMKNVMLSKRETLEVVAPPAVGTMPALTLAALAVVPPPQRGGGACRMPDGPIEAQVEALAEYLRPYLPGGR